MEDLKLNAKDWKIIKELDLDARQSNSDLAKEVKLSKNVVNYQVKRMESLGLLKKYITLVDYSKLGHIQFGAYLDLYELDPQKEEELLQYLVKDKKTGIVARTLGDWDVIFTMHVKHPLEFYGAWNKMMEKFRGLIRNYATNLVTTEHLFSRTYLVSDKQAAKTSWDLGGSSPEEKVDEVDLSLLKLLSDHARIPIKDLATKVGLGSMAIIYRLKQLAKKKIIVGHRADLNFEALGYEHYKVTLELEDFKLAKELAGFCRSHPHVISITEAISDNADFEFDVEVKGLTAFHGFMETLKKQFPGTIRNYKYIHLLNLHKVVHLAG
ncbi:Lrp/AsnC family transcriptional regulator [Candidatus Woesearchaeota archaeon]|nr:Lrp/AsnC family transcriptional regulator [Candidatus Woesearchaeota archaeon]